MARCKETGFTLLEVMIAFIIIALMAGLAVPALDRVLEGQALNSYARQLVGDLRYVRQRNINGDLTVRLYWTSDNYQIWQGTNVVTTKKAPSGVEIISEADQISFSVSGGTSDATTILLQNTYGNQYRITVAVGTGRIKCEAVQD